MNGSNRFIQPGITRMPISRWHELWCNDPTEWTAELLDRPVRYDAQASRSAVRKWRNPTGREELRPPDSPLAGAPFLVKDLFDETGEVTGCSSRVVLEEQTLAPASEDALLIRALRSRGAYPAGRTHMNEFAYGLDGMNEYSGNCPHPLDSTRISGGSSSGSAWAVAAGIVPLALGSDTGGSVRVPAALCGIYGLRPAWNPGDNAGLFPLAASFDVAGWFTAGSADMRLMLDELVAGVAEASRGDPSRPYWYYLPPEVEIDAQLAATVEKWRNTVRDESGGSVIVEPAPEFWTKRVDRAMRDVLWAYNVVGSYEAWTVHAKWLDTFRDSYQPVVWALIDRGRHWSSERIAAARAVVAEVKAHIEDALHEAEGLLLPVTPLPTPTASQIDGSYREQTLRLNAPGSMAGAAVLSAPVHVDAIRSSGVQVIVPGGEEVRLLPILRALDPRRAGSR